MEERVEHIDWWDERLGKVSINQGGLENQLIEKEVHLSTHGVVHSICTLTRGHNFKNFVLEKGCSNWYISLVSPRILRLILARRTELLMAPLTNLCSKTKSATSRQVTRG